jgi:hypothetical protein
MDPAVASALREMRRRLDERTRARLTIGRVGLETELLAVPVVLSDADRDEMKRRELLFPEEIERDGIDA